MAIFLYVAGAIVELAKAIGLLVVGEGIETAEQAAALTALRCDLGQGFHFARPLEAEEISRRLAAAAPVATPLGGDGGAEERALSPSPVPLPPSAG